MAHYRGAIIGLGWMGMLYDLAQRTGVWNVDDIDRPTPELDLHRKFHFHDHPGDEGLPTSYAEALWDRPEIDLIAAADRDRKRLRAFGDRYGVQALYTDAEKMLRQEKPDIVAIATNTKHRADLTCLAVECGARGIFTEKPMVHTFGRAKKLVQSGAIGELASIEASGPGAQHQNWSYFLESVPSWVVGTGDQPRRESGSDEFTGQGMMVTEEGLVVHFRTGAPGVRLCGTEGEIVFNYLEGWRLWQDVEIDGSKHRVEMPWPKPQFVPPYGGVYSLKDVMDCLAGELDEPKNSGRPSRSR